eukprot:TRINITY_DN5187_c0_g3_i1.p1 TRINITY_DN5187_c0_g3~~TRINITY_DN5187_c0_g3_i1.p1  ORF type:complete len:177 (+),score=22.66 TRINITY_DN5187_c0_g3_i1:55-585(+)
MWTMNACDDRGGDWCKRGCSLSSALTANPGPSKLEAHGEAHDTDSVSTCCSALEIPDEGVDDEVSQDSLEAVALQQLECSVCSDAKGTRSESNVRACWSVGSAGHSAGRCCKPCPYVRMGQQCLDGLNCMMCHLEHSEDSSAIRLALTWVARQRTRAAARARRSGDGVEKFSILSL